MAEPSITKEEVEEMLDNLIPNWRDQSLDQTIEEAKAILFISDLMAAELLKQKARDN